ncbi:MAG TPA: hypothetical protein VLA20_13140, partial [Vicinamibacterales bacterium]|nr:hypothetical protein [Vicinamibacterales bacterium]
MTLPSPARVDTHKYTRLDRRAAFGPNVAGNVRAGLATSVEQLAQAEVERGRLWHLCRELFGRVDALLTPTMAVPPSRLRARPAVLRCLDSSQPSERRRLP